MINSTQALLLVHLSTRITADVSWRNYRQTLICFTYRENTCNFEYKKKYVAEGLWILKFPEDHSQSIIFIMTPARIVIAIVCRVKFDCMNPFSINGSPLMSLRVWSCRKGGTQWWVRSKTRVHGEEGLMDLLWTCVTDAMSSFNLLLHSS